MARRHLTLAVLLVAPRVASAEPTGADLAEALEMAGAQTAAIDAAIDQSVATTSRWLAAWAATEAAEDGALGRAGLDAAYSGWWDTSIQDVPTAFAIDASSRAELGYTISRRGELRGIATSGGAVTIRGMLEPEAADQVAPFELTASYDLERRPALTDPRNGLRAASTSASASVRVPLIYYRSGRNRHAFWESRLGGALTQQGDRVLQQHHFDTRVYYYCRVRAGTASPFCIDALVWNATGVTGVDKALIHELYPLRLAGVPVGLGLGLDVAAGGLTNTGSMTVSKDDQPIQTITSEDLPQIFVGAWDARLHGPVGGAGFEARWRRAGWVSLDGDLTIEDRASASISVRAGRTSLALSGFVADTRWWTTMADPGYQARTGGGELTVGRKIADLDVVATVGAARSFYATMDGGAPTDTGLGVRGGISISRPIWGQPEE